MAQNQFFVDSDKLSGTALEHKHLIENDPSARTDHMEYLEGMEKISSDIMDKVLKARETYQADRYTAEDVKQALEHERCTIEDFAALLSPAAAPFLEKVAWKAKEEKEKHFGTSVYMFTPFIFRIIVKIIAFTAVLTAITGFTG